MAKPVIIAKLTFQDGKREEGLRVFDQMFEHVNTNEPGTLIYEISISEDGSLVHSYERLADSEAALTHFGTVGETFLERFLAALDPERIVVYGTPSAALKEATAAFHPTYMQPLAGFTR